MNLKQILIDITTLVNELRRKRPPHGIPRVTLAYIKNYFDSMQVLIRGRKRIFILSQIKSKEIGLLLLDWNPGSFGEILKLIVKGILFSHRSKTRDYVLIKTDHYGFKNPNYINALNKNNIKLVAVVHDLIPILNPEFGTESNKVKFSISLSTILHHAMGVVTVSDTTHEHLKSYIQKENISGPPMITSTLAPGVVSLESKSQPIVTGPYFVTVSTIGARKNHLLLLQIWRNMVGRLGANAPKLVIIGKRSSTCANTIAMLDHCQELQGVIIETTCSDQELIRYIKHAKALLFPSFAEGYGLPLIEALSLNVPVIASNLKVFRETAGEIPDYFDSLDGLGWMSCIENYAQEHSTLRTAQLQRLTHFRIPTWQEHFTKVDEFIKSLE